MYNEGVLERWAKAALEEQTRLDARSQSHVLLVSVVGAVYERADTVRVALRRVRWAGERMKGDRWVRAAVEEARERGSWAKEALGDDGA